VIDREQAEKVLPSWPEIWGDDVGLGFRARWLPGAFGEGVEQISEVFGFVVKEDEWEERRDGTLWRTIKRAEVKQTFEQAEDSVVVRRWLDG
jgi:hypothetical protein